MRTVRSRTTPARCAVLIPTYQRAHMLSDALESLACQPCEVYVYDDGSTDGTQEVAERYGAHYRKGPHEGMTPAFNRGVEWVREGGHELVAFLGSDDAYAPGSVELRMAELDRTGADCVFSGLRFVHERRWVPRRGADHHIDVTRYGPEFSTFQGNVHTGTAMLRLDKWIPWHEDIVTGGADLLWVYEMWHAGYTFAYVGRVLYYVRRHPGRQIMKRRAMDQGVVKKELDEVYWPLVERIREGR